MMKKFAFVALAAMVGMSVAHAGDAADDGDDRKHRCDDMAPHRPTPGSRPAVDDCAVRAELQRGRAARLAGIVPSGRMPMSTDRRPAPALSCAHRSPPARP